MLHAHNNAQSLSPKKFECQSVNSRKKKKSRDKAIAKHRQPTRVKRFTLNSLSHNLESVGSVNLKSSELKRGFVAVGDEGE